MTRLRNRHFLLSDLILLPIAVYLSYVLRLEEIDPASRWWPGMIALAATVPVVTVFVFYKNGVYSRYWRYASVDEVTLLTGAFTISMLLASLVAFAIGLVLQQGLWIPRSIPFIMLLLGLVATAGPRLFIRIWTRRQKRNQSRAADAQPVLVVGAGDTGAALVRDIQHHPELGLHVVGLVDDDKRKRDAVIHGVPVLGNRDDIPALSRDLGVKQVIIAMPSASGKQIREVVGICEDANVQTRTVPGMPELLDGSVTINQVREVRIDDLLRRDPIATDLAAVRKLLQGKCVLITGGGGSIGSELARQVYNCAPERLVLLGHGENSVFRIYHELLGRNEASGNSTGLHIEPVIADIRSEAQMNRVLRDVRPQVIFHAAAHKHVPLMEMNPGEAILNNIGGTRCLLAAAETHEVDRFVMISTDKAVNPTNVMGATKRIAEQLVLQTAASTGRAYVTVRFGNVLGSSGSVVPIFQRQIATGGPVTVTHPDVERYFMTIPEAVQLVLQASVLGDGGELFMLDMGEPVKIADLAKDLIRLSGLELGRDIDIEYTNLRPGDKLYEEMFMSSEAYARTQHAQIFIAQTDDSVPLPSLADSIDSLLRAAQFSEADALVRELAVLVPEYAPHGDVKSRIGRPMIAEGAFGAAPERAGIE